MYRELGGGKIMFSSDNVYQIPVELAKYRSVIHDENDLDRILSRNLIDVFHLRI
jgi:predicted TIM-barrel fold metal-dependent hydrolase